MTVLTLEGISYVGERYLVSKGIIYEPPKLEEDAYRLKPDLQLGWPSPDLFGKGDYDSSGSRIIPSFPDPNEEACVSAYGDSFTWGHEVGNEFAWSNVLSKILDCRVSNFGVSCYGTDQSYLRFKHNDPDQPGIRRRSYRESVYVISGEGRKRKSGSRTVLNACECLFEWFGEVF